MDMNQYLDIFTEESREHLQHLNSSLLQLEKNHNDKGCLNEIFRVAHTLKGMAGTMGFTKMQMLTHHMEDVLDALRNNRIEIEPSMVDILFKCLDALETYVGTIAVSGAEGDETYQDVLDALTGILNGSGSDKPEMPPVKSEDKPAASTAGKLRIEFNEYDKNVIGKAFESGMNVFEIHVVFDKGCLLKAARAFVVFQVLERNGEVIKSVPAVEDIEDERFDFEFTVVVITQKNKELFEKEINSIAEIEKVEVTPVTPEHIGLNAAANEARAEIAAAATAAVQAEKTADVHTNVKEHENTEQPIRKRTGKTVRVDIERLDTLMNLVSELIIVKNGLESNLENGQADIDSIEYLERITTSIHDAVMKVRMVPVETVFNRFPRMIRDISRELNKEIELHMSGEETELDRTVIDEIGDPLIHILRNSADHGIESLEDRIKANKPTVGNIYLRAFQDGNTVVIEVEDDGRGIDVEKVRRKIVEKGLETYDIVNSFSDKEVIDFLFKPNFSTADKITDISGRGVGLDVVKTKIEALGGIVEVKTEWGKGTKFSIRIPLTLAIIQALMVEVGSEKYAIPLGSISEIDNFKPEDIKFVRNQEVVSLRNMVIPVVRLDKILNVPDSIPDDKKKNLTCVIVKKGDKLSAFLVDSLIGQQEIVIKSIGKILSGVKNIAGATILGDGNVALILDVNSLAL